GWQLVRGTSSTSSGKKYFEIRQDTADPGPGYEIAGVAKSGASVGSYLGNGAYGWGYQHGLRRTVHNGGFSTYGTAPVSAQGTVIGVLLDLDAGTLSFSVNGALQGIAFSGLSGTFHPAVSHYALMTSTARFASSQWSYAPPAGYTQW
ncbi:MAG: SPRY domain-containing protein, partial [Gammaproteobacteria bacterium]|nr:SPRY domain-containing protein [Gammaproteobacteria bacterium]